MKPPAETMRLVCTCTQTTCPYHPSNHSLGCAPCIAKNQKRREIPACFFNLAGGGPTTTASGTYYFEDFAALVSRCAKAGEEPMNNGMED